jgi:hypothetical protein
MLNNKNTFFGLLLLLVISALADKKDDIKENYGTVIGIDLGTTYSWYANKSN